ncbi:MAG: DUF1460 domain-containing protein [Bacteroidetes bacterium]|nr:DUF1460 domain-containing protein [Bacteroidota bacterium]
MNRRNFIKSISIGAGVVLTSPILKINVFADNKNTIAGREKYNSIIQTAIDERWHYLPIDELIARISISFLKVPYLAHSLEKHPERVVINFAGLDCVTLVELSFNMARQIKLQRYNIDDLEKLIMQTRYKNGKIIDYSSRLHYTSDWIIENTKNNLVADITRELGGIEHQFNYNFMSNNYKLYPALKNDKTNTLLTKIKNNEEQLNLNKMYIIPTNKIRTISKKIKDGDIICIAISNKGLDYGHLGFAYYEKLLHASSKNKEVVLDSSISSFVTNYKNSIGITILRANSEIN